MRKAAAYLAAAACLTGLLTGCGGGAAVSGENDDPLSGLTPAGSMELSYAEQFTVDTFEGGLSLITIGGEDRYLVVPEGQQVPQTGADITVLQQPPRAQWISSFRSTRSIPSRSPAPVPTAGISMRRARP